VAKRAVRSPAVAWTFRAVRVTLDFLHPAANKGDETMDLHIAKFAMLGGALLFVLAVLVVFVL
jgi:hypothetical protein